MPYMWKRITDPDILIFLDASFEVCTARRQLNWNQSDYLQQLQRLEHARQHADLIIQTDQRSPDQVLNEVLSHLGGQRFRD